MKKILNILLIVSLSTVLVACGTAKQTDDSSKQAEIQKQVDDLKEQVSKLKDEQNGVEHKTPETKKTEEPKETAKPAAKEYSISVDNYKDGDTVKVDPATFTGTVSDDATKIVVTANKGTKNEDVYTLTGFKAGDKKFSYKASKSYSNMVSGANTYEFTVSFKDGTTKSVKLNINFSK